MIESGATFSQLIRVVDQQQRVLDLDADQRDKADHCGEAQRVPAQQQPDHAADHTQRHYRRDDHHALEGFELEDEHDQNTDGRQQNRATKAAEAFLPAFDFARGQPPISVRHHPRLQRIHRGARESVGVESGADLTRHSHTSFRIKMFDARQGALQGQRGHLRQRNLRASL